MSKETDYIIKRLCKYMVIYKIVNAIKLLIYTFFMLYIMDILIEYYDHELHILHIDMVYIIFILLAIMLFETLYECDRNLTLSKLIHKYNDISNGLDKDKIYYLIIGYISIHKSFLLSKLQKDTDYVV